jgi:hypothetical protein
VLMWWWLRWGPGATVASWVAPPSPSWSTPWRGHGGDDSGVAAAGCHRGPMGRRLADRGPGAAASGGHKKECPVPCSGPTAAAPNPLPWTCARACSRGGGQVMGMSVGAEGRRFATAGRQWRRRRGGSCWTQGRGDGRAPRVGCLGGPGKEEVCLRLLPSGEDEGARAGHSHDDHHHHRSVCFLLPPEPGQHVHLHETPRFSHLSSRYYQGPGPETGPANSRALGRLRQAGQAGGEVVLEASADMWQVGLAITP